MGWDYSPKPSHMTRTQHVDAELHRVMRGTMIRRTGIIAKDGQHVWSLHLDTDGTPYGVCTLIDRGAYKFVSTTMGPRHTDPPSWLTDVLVEHGPANEYECVWLDHCRVCVTNPTTS